MLGVDALTQWVVAPVGQYRGSLQCRGPGLERVGEPVSDDD